MLNVLLLWSILSSVSTMISLFSFCAFFHCVRTVFHLVFWLCVLLLFGMSSAFGTDHCLYIDAINIFLQLGTLSSIHIVDVLLFSRSCLRVYTRLFFMRIAFLELLVMSYSVV